MSDSQARVKAVVFDFGGVMTTTTMPERVKPIVDGLGLPWSAIEAGFGRYRRLMDASLISMAAMYDLIFADAAIAVDPAALAKAEAARKKGRGKDALKLYQEALAADPLSYPAALGLAKAWETTDSSQNGQQKAFEAYKTACTLRPSAVTTFVTAGALAMKLGFVSQAVEIYSRAVAASPTSFDALDGLIRALRKVGNKGKVAQAYQSYRDSIPANRK